VSRGSQPSPRKPEYAKLIELVREARIASKLQQKEICDRLAKPKNYLNKVERGERRLDVVELFELCQAMEVDAIALLQTFACSIKNDHG
jgi:transcriptional regulator with XRE-family HTH domain